MFQRDILETFQQALIVARDQSIMPELPIAFVDVAFEVPDDQKYLEVVFIPNGAVEYWGDERQYRGIFRLVLHWPKNGVGPYLAFDVLASVAEYFTKDRILQNMRIYETATLTGIVDGGADVLYPATLRYESFRF